GVPLVPAVSLQRFGRAGNQQLVGALLPAPWARGDNPAQTRLHHVDPERVRKVLAAQPFDRERALFESGSYGHNERNPSRQRDKRADHISPLPRAGDEATPNTSSWPSAFGREPATTSAGQPERRCGRPR